jgi:dipeptidyl aminopeptidase/acylaminoacyl peptidase
MRTITPEDLLNFKFIHDSSISGDGKSILFTVTQPKGENEYFSAIWKHSQNQLRPLIANLDRATTPLWSPIGNEFLFSAISSHDKGVSQLWVADSNGLNRRRVLNLEGKIDATKWSPDGKYIFFISDYDLDTKPKAHSDFIVVNRMNYRFDGEGHFRGKRPHIFKVAAASGKLDRITAGEFDVSCFDVSHDGSHVAFGSNTDPEADYQNNMDIYTVQSESGHAIRKLTSMRGPIASIAYSPDGSYIAFIADDYRFRFNTPLEVWVYGLKNGKTTNLSRKLDRPARNSIVSDVMMDKDSAPLVWSGDSKEVYFVTTDRGSCNIFACEISTGKTRQITNGKNVVTGFSLSQNGSIALVRMDPIHLPELFLIEEPSAEPRQLTEFNSDLLSDICLSVQKEFVFRASDKVEVHGFLLPPVGNSKRKKNKFPCIVEIHGGGGTEGFQFMHEFQCLTAQGYAVLTCNFRGTSGYGAEFMRVLTGHYMEKDYSDIIDMVKYAIREEWIDKEKLGVTGGSYGGYLTNWAVGHSNLFAAAVTDRSVVNLYSFYGTSDDYRLIEEDVQMSFPWDRPEHYLAKSAISYTKKVTTPLLIMHAEQDFRCRLEQAEQLYAFLKRQKKEVEFVIFPEESHGLSRGGKPHHRVERLQFMLWWFTTHIKTGKIVERPV